jgi:hypothetical protein
MVEAIVHHQRRDRQLGQALAPARRDQALKSQRVWVNGPFPNPRACTGMSW